jgi:hypothetical protein
MIQKKSKHKGLEAIWSGFSIYLLLKGSNLGYRKFVAPHEGQPTLSESLSSVEVFQQKADSFNYRSIAF